MQKVKIIVRNYEKKDGGKFTKLTIGGKYINDVLAEESQQYQVKFTSKSAVKEPNQEGIYEVAFNDGEAWIDIFFDDHQTASDFGVQYKDVYMRY